MNPAKSQNNPRYQAYQILKLVMIDGHSLSQALSVNKEVMPFAKMISFGVLRNHQRLSLIIDKLVTKRPKKKSLLILLMMGIFQLLTADKPDYAAVSETVSLTKTDKLAWAKGMVNGVLRRFIREREAILQDCGKAELYRNNHPQWLVDKLWQHWPEQASSLLVENDRQAPMTLRVNLAKTTRAAYLQALEKTGMKGVLSPIVNSAITLLNPVDVSQLPGFAQGLISVQDSAAQLAAPLLQLKTGQRVLDACCAPGGKTGHILESTPDLAELVAIDISEQRLDKVRENLERLNLKANLLCADAADSRQWWNGQPFDRILLDAPCSATGVIRRHPDIKYHRKPEDIPKLVATQQHLLNALWSTLKPGGLLLYATCSILPEENEQQMESFCRAHSDAKLQPITIKVSSGATNGLQLFPRSNEHDGFYYAALCKS